MGDRQTLGGAFLGASRAIGEFSRQRATDERFEQSLALQREREDRITEQNRQSRVDSRGAARGNLVGNVGRGLMTPEAGAIAAENFGAAEDLGARRPVESGGFMLSGPAETPEGVRDSTLFGEELRGAAPPRAPLDVSGLDDVDDATLQTMIASSSGRNRALLENLLANRQQQQREETGFPASRRELIETATTSSDPAELRGAVAGLQQLRAKGPAVERALNAAEARLDEIRTGRVSDIEDETAAGERGREPFRVEGELRRAEIDQALIDYRQKLDKQESEDEGTQDRINRALEDVIGEYQKAIGSLANADIGFAELLRGLNDEDAEIPALRNLEAPDRERAANFAANTAAVRLQSALNRSEREALLLADQLPAFILNQALAQNPELRDALGL